MVIPAYNAGSFLRERLELLHAYLDTGAAAKTWEIVVVDDGSTDNTAAVIAECVLSNIVVVTSAVNRGKFGAVILGMAAASGRCRIFTDADIPYANESIGEVTRLILDANHRVVTGDRTLATSQYRQDLGPLRKVATMTFSGLVRLFVRPDLADTQCGLKGFSAETANAIFPLMHEWGFAGDVELLYIAAHHRLDIVRIPVVLQFSGDTTVRPFAHGRAMLKALVRIRWRRTRGQYESPALRALA